MGKVGRIMEKRESRQVVMHAKKIMNLHFRNSTVLNQQPASK